MAKRRSNKISRKGNDMKDTNIETNDDVVAETAALETVEEIKIVESTDEKTPEEVSDNEVVAESVIEEVVTENDSIDEEVAEESSVVEEKELSLLEEIKKELSDRALYYKDKITLNALQVREQSCRLAKIAIKVHNSNDPKVLNTYLDYLVKYPNTITNIVTPMDVDIGNSSRERNSVSMMQAALEKIARAIRKNTKVAINFEPIMKDVTNKTVINFINSKIDS